MDIDNITTSSTWHGAIVGFPPVKDAKGGRFEPWCFELTVHGGRKTDEGYEPATVVWTIRGARINRDGTLNKRDTARTIPPRFNEEGSLLRRFIVASLREKGGGYVIPTIVDRWLREG